MRTLKLLIAFVLMGLILSSCSSHKDLHTASREPTGLAPDPSVTKEAVLQVYGADTWIAKQVPKLDLDLPFSAIGSGYVD